MNEVLSFFLTLGAITLAAYAAIIIWRISGVPLGIPRVPPCAEGGHAISDRNPESLGLGFFEVVVESPFGSCPAWYVPGGSDVDTWAVIVHGRGGNRSSSLDLLPMLHEMGISSLVVSYRNDGTAPPSADGLDHLGGTEWIDVQAAMRYALERGAKKLVMVGRSAGGAIVGQVLNRSGAGKHVSRVLLEDPVLDWRSVFMHGKPGWMPRWFASLVLLVSQFRIEHRLSEFDLIENPPLWRPPTLIIHGMEDATVPYSISHRFSRARSRDRGWPTLSLVGIPGADHGMSRVQDPEGFDRIVTSWLGREVRDEAR